MSLDVDAAIMEVPRESVMRVEGRHDAPGSPSCLMNARPRDHARAAVGLGVSRDKLSTFTGTRGEQDYLSKRQLRGPSAKWPPDGASGPA